MSSTDLGKSLKNGKGAKVNKVQSAMRGARLSKLSDVTPNKVVNPDPRADPRKEPPFKRLINVANKVASTPSGHNRAAKTNTGIKDTCPSTVNKAESPSAKTSLLMPRDLFIPVISIS